MPTRYWVTGSTGGTGNWSSTNNWSASSGGSPGASVPDTGDPVIFNASSGTGVSTLDISRTINRLTMTGFSGTLAFGTNTITISGVSIQFTGSTTCTVTGTPLIIITGTGAKVITAGAVSETNSISFEINSGGSSGTTISTGGFIRSLTFVSPYTGALASAEFSLYGDLKLVSGMSVTSTPNNINFVGTSGIQKITTDPVSVARTLNFAGTATYQLQDALTSSNARTHVLTSGTLDLNGFTFTNAGNFSSNNSNVRTLKGPGSYICSKTLSGTPPVWDCANLTNFSITGNPSATFQATSSLTSTTIQHGTTAGSEAQAMSFKFGGYFSDIYFTTSYIQDLTFLNTGTNPQIINTTPTIYGSYYNLNSSTTNPLTSITLASTSASANFMQSVYAQFPTTVNVSGGAVSVYKLLQNQTSPQFSALNVSSSFNTNGFDLSCNSFNFNNSNTKTITVSSGNFIKLVGGTGAFTGSMTGTTLSLAGSSVIFSISGTFNVPNSTFPELSVLPVSSNISVTVGSSGNTQTITTIKEKSNSGGAIGRIILFYGSTLIFTDMVYTNDGNVTAYLTTNSSATQATLSKASGTIIYSARYIRDIIATGGAVFKAPVNQGNVNGGNNVGWDFNPYPLQNQFFMFF